MSSMCRHFFLSGKQVSGNDNKFVDGKPNDAQLWNRVAANLNSEGQICMMGHQVMTKVNALKIDYKAFHLLKDQTDVGWDFVKNTINVDDAWWLTFPHNASVSVRKGSWVSCVSDIFSVGEKEQYGWQLWAAEVNKYCKNFRNHGLQNYEELHLLFNKSFASGALGQASSQRAPTTRGIGPKDEQPLWHSPRGRDHVIIAHEF
ncbi:hypothetical protein CJ030_MR4G020419 [Morella rubra]|uniref:Myb/SANT-like domain-containing protein n=1 Tax=Morella rubra TaxID=262757 RepID=A0A6A1VS66_9ROSI|nr:hypothetical protein CJ030_MR4G020419 [Morella rubra]